jgi:hypothetical protein
MSDHATGYCPQARADQRALPRVMNPRSDNSAGARPQGRAADNAFFRRGQALCPAAAGNHNQQPECCRRAYEDRFHKTSPAAGLCRVLRDVNRSGSLH